MIDAYVGIARSEVLSAVSALRGDASLPHMIAATFQQSAKAGAFAPALDADGLLSPSKSIPGADAWRVDRDGGTSLPVNTAEGEQPAPAPMLTPGLLSELEARHSKDNRDGQQAWVPDASN